VSLPQHRLSLRFLPSFVGVSRSFPIWKVLPCRCSLRLSPLEQSPQDCLFFNSLGNAVSPSFVPPPLKPHESPSDSQYPSLLEILPPSAAHHPAPLPRNAVDKTRSRHQGFLSPSTKLVGAPSSPPPADSSFPRWPYPLIDVLSDF